MKLPKFSKGFTYCYYHYSLTICCAGLAAAGWGCLSDYFGLTQLFNPVSDFQCPDDIA